MADTDRTLMAKLARASRGGLISIDEAAAVLDLPRDRVSAKLASLARRGWLQRARRGLYLVAPLEAQPSHESIAEDPWVLAAEVFFPCYIGGWSAAEYWGLTEQLFRTTLVVTARSARAKEATLLGHDFRLFRVSSSRLDGTVAVWRGADRVPTSGPERTIVDGLRNPELCGGVRHIVEILTEYRASEHYDLEALLRTATDWANGAAWKRLGYLFESLWPTEADVVSYAGEQISSGIIQLDPAVRRRGPIVRRWNLRANVPVAAAPPEGDR